MVDLLYIRKECKQNSYVTNGEVLKANKYETSSKNQSKVRLKMTTKIGNACK
jgi:hypothetical protein